MEEESFVLFGMGSAADMIAIDWSRDVRKLDCGP
jgi:hypothetical protein